jgi:hypothetical protein
MGKRQDTSPKPRFCASILFDEPTWYAIREMADENFDGSVSAMVRSLVRQAEQRKATKKQQGVSV